MNKKDNKKDKNVKRVVDLTRFISRDDAKYDPDGMYTGIPNEVFFDNVYERPIQDADDL